MSTLKKCPFCGSKNYIYLGIGKNRNTIQCNQCSGRGPIEDTRTVAELSWNNRQDELKWTKNPPTKAGFYFYRNLFGCVQVVKFVPKLMNVAYRAGEWAGPIPEPAN